MIIVRYLSRQILQLTAAITFVLLTVAVLIRFLNYMARASQGQIDPDVLLLLMAYRLPEFIQLTLPLAFMLGILLSFSRMYADNEMTVLSACGLSSKRLLGIAFASSALLMFLLLLLSLRLTPMGLVNSSALLEAQQDLNEFDIMVPGIFQNIGQGQRTTYAESINGNRMQEVFMYERDSNSVTVAESARLNDDPQLGRSVLFSNGSISRDAFNAETGTGSGASFTNFEELLVVLPQREINISFDLEEKAMPTSALLGSSNPAWIAELQWRISLIILIPVLTLLAVPLSRVEPRQGRFARLIPALLCYLVYFGLLLAARDMTANGQLPPWLGMWWVHLLFLLLGLSVFMEKIPDIAVLRWLK